jgi:hypothetical protein
MDDFVSNNSNVITFDGVLHAYGSFLSNGTLYVKAKTDSFTLPLNRLNVKVKEKFLLHIDQHAFAWIGWKNVSEPLPIRLLTKNLKDRVLSSYKCKRYILSPVMIFGVSYFPRYGHVMFNSHGNLVDTIWNSNFLDKNINRSVLLYAALDNDSNANKYSFYLQMKMFQQVFSALSSEKKIRSYHALLRLSYQSKICFRDLTVGLTAGLDHYNASVSTSQWLKYGQHVLKLLGFSKKDSEPFSTSNECTVTIVSRKQNRRITNENELADAIKHEEGLELCKVQIVQFENYNLATQLRYIRNTTVLIGMDGSGRRLCDDAPRSFE